MRLAAVGVALIVLSATLAGPVVLAVVSAIGAVIFLALALFGAMTELDEAMQAPPGGDDPWRDPFDGGPLP